MSNWQKVRLGDVCEFNPKESIKKGVVAKKIAMDCLIPYSREISNFELAEFLGGTKFRNGDTIMARITPCLENGKTSLVTVLDDNEVGFGSTEYIVFREKEGITTSKFVYYFVTNPNFRNIAIQSMVGSSGRQRVQQGVLENLKVDLPPLAEQERIAGILGALDDKIECNNRINRNLEEQAAALFRRWFVDFEFPDSQGKPYRSSGGVFTDSPLGKIPTNWSVGKLSDIANVTSGKRPPCKFEISTIENYIPIVGASSIMGYTNNVLYDEKILVIGRVGTHGVVQRFSYPCWTSDNTLVIKSDYYEFANQILNKIDYNSINRGSTQPLITQADINNTAIILPSNKTLVYFENVCSNLMNKHLSNIKENRALAELRDSLLPKLMNNELSLDELPL